jgi:hypothetical protein
MYLEVLKISIARHNEQHAHSTPQSRIFQHNIPGGPIKSIYIE